MLLNNTYTHTHTHSHPHTHTHLAINLLVELNPAPERSLDVSPVAEFVLWVLSSTGSNPKPGLFVEASPAAV